MKPNIRVWQVLIALVVVLLTAVGCTQNSAQDGTASSPATASTPAPQHATAHPSSTKAKATQAPETVDSYQNDPARLARIYTAVQKFGQIVVAQSKDSDSPWGPFDAYCSDAYEGGSNSGGYRSQGYQPTSTDDCQVQHNPQYGGPSIQLNADVLVGQHGMYTNTIVEGDINTSTCNVSVHYIKGIKLPDVTIGNPPHQAWSGDVTTVKAAEAIDDKAVTCLNGTRP